RDAVLSIGSDDRSRVWLDGALVHEFDPPEHAATGADAFRVPVRLRRGRNRLLIKVTNGLNPHRFYLRIITDRPALLDATAQAMAREGKWAEAASMLVEADRRDPAGAGVRLTRAATALL